MVPEYRNWIHLCNSQSQITVYRRTTKYISVIVDRRVFCRIMQNQSIRCWDQRGTRRYPNVFDLCKRCQIVGSNDEGGTLPPCLVRWLINLVNFKFTEWSIHIPTMVIQHQREGNHCNDQILKIKVFMEELHYSLSISSFRRYVLVDAGERRKRREGSLLTSRANLR